MPWTKQSHWNNFSFLWESCPLIGQEGASLCSTISGLMEIYYFSVPCILRRGHHFLFSLHMFERLFGLSFNLEDTGFLMWEMFEGFEGWIKHTHTMQVIKTLNRALNRNVNARTTYIIAACSKRMLVVDRSSGALPGSTGSIPLRQMQT